MYAAGNGHALAVEALLAGGADVGQVNPKVRRREGVGAVRWAVWEGDG
jgi:ankyrin repeat protein